MASWNIMQTTSRSKHPSRDRFYAFVHKMFGSNYFIMLDVGIVSLVDYVRMKKYKDLNFKYIGVDINPDIVSQAKTLIEHTDNAFVWDIHHIAPKNVSEYQFDVILVKNMIHYCKTYGVLSNLIPVLKDTGYIYIINNENIFSSKNTCKELKEITYGLGKYGSQYSKDDYIKYLNKNFVHIKHKKFKRSNKFKSYSIDILGKKL